MDHKKLWALIICKSAQLYYMQNNVMSEFSQQQVHIMFLKAYFLLACQ